MDNKLLGHKHTIQLYTVEMDEMLYNILYCKELKYQANIFIICTYIGP